MQTHIQSHGFSLTKALREYTQKRLGYAVSFAGDHIRRITVKLSDINGPRGGEDKRCHVVVTLQNMPSVIIEDVQSNLYTAIDRAVERAGWAVTRVMRRKHAHRFDTSKFLGQLS